jgi:hypothetical protein
MKNMIKPQLSIIEPFPKPERADVAKTTLANEFHELDFFEECVRDVVYNWILRLLLIIIRTVNLCIVE